MKHSIWFRHRSKIGVAAVNFTRALRELAPNWQWKVDGVATAIVLTVLLLNKTSVKATAVGPWMNVVAIFSLGIVLHRNLRTRKKANPAADGKLASRWGRRRG